MGDSIIDINAFLQAQDSKDQLRFLTCGSVDDGKSTLLGRLLYDSKTVFEDQLSAAGNESRKYGTQGENVDLRCWSMACKQSANRVLPSM